MCRSVLLTILDVSFLLLHLLGLVSLRQEPSISLTLLEMTSLTKCKHSCKQSLQLSLYKIMSQIRNIFTGLLTDKKMTK